MQPYTPAHTEPTARVERTALFRTLMDSIAVELSKGRKCAIMQVSINPHPVDETSDIPSIPELQADLHSAVMGYDMLVRAGYHSTYSSMRRMELAAQRLDDARWQLAMESNRWVHRDAVAMWGGERGYWAARRAMQCMKWACRHLSPSTGKELELHPTVFPAHPMIHRVGRGAQR